VRGDRASAIFRPCQLQPKVKHPLRRSGGRVLQDRRLVVCSLWRDRQVVARFVKPPTRELCRWPSECSHCRYEASWKPAVLHGSWFFSVGVSMYTSNDKNPGGSGPPTLGGRHPFWACFRIRRAWQQGGMDAREINAGIDFCCRVRSTTP